MNNFENITLKECPFCGSNPIWKKSYSGMGNTTEYVYIQCPKCRISTDKVLFWEHTLTEIIPLVNAWNIRKITN